MCNNVEATLVRLPLVQCLAEALLALTVLWSVAEDTFVREWALFAVRNMCEVSADAQQVIRCVPESTLEFCAESELASRELDAQSAPTLDPAD